MKIITLLLVMASIDIAEANVYKCPGKIEGQYTYQARPCKGATADEHTVKILSSPETVSNGDEKKSSSESENSEKTELTPNGNINSNNPNAAVPPTPQPPPDHPKTMDSTSVRPAPPPPGSAPPVRKPIDPVNAANNKSAPIK
jgi:hypothetical protein